MGKECEGGLPQQDGGAHGRAPLRESLCAESLVFDYDPVGVNVSVPPAREKTQAPCPGCRVAVPVTVVYVFVPGLNVSTTSAPLTVTATSSGFPNIMK